MNIRNHDLKNHPPYSPSTPSTLHIQSHPQSRYLVSYLLKVNKNNNPRLRLSRIHTPSSSREHHPIPLLPLELSPKKKAECIVLVSICAVKFSGLQVPTMFFMA